MRRLAAILLALASLAALPAAKPVPPGDGPTSGGPEDETRSLWRGQAVSICVARLRPVRELSPDDLESICGCAVDRFMDANASSPLPAADPERLPRMLGGPLVSCAARTRPERASDIMRQIMATPSGPPPVVAPETGPLETANTVKPGDEGEDAVPADSESGGNWYDGISNWFASLSLPAWLTGAGLPFWIAIGIFVFGLLILKFRTRDTRKDLTGPPSHMRRGAPLQPPRRPDLPRQD